MVPSNTGDGATFGAGGRPSSGALPTIRRKLATMVIAGVLPSVLAIVLLFGHFYEHERDQREKDALQTVRALMAAVDRDLAIGEHVARALATSHNLADDDFAAFHVQAKSVLDERFPGFTFVLSDATGQQRVNVLRSFGDPLPRHGNPEQLQKVFATGKPVVSDLYIGGITRRPLVGIDVPVWRDGKVVYALSVGFLPERLGRILAEQRLPPNQVAAIFDTKGVIVARTHLAESFVGKSGAAPLVRLMRDVEEGVVETSTLEGIPVYSIFSRSMVSGWSVALGIPRSVVLSEILRSVAVIAFLVFALLAGGFLLAWKLGGRIGQAVRDLTVPVLALGARAPVTVPAVSFREAEEVVGVVKEVERELVGHRQRLEALIAERTSRLAQILEAAGEGIFGIDGDGRCTFVNPAACRMLGWSVAEIVGQPQHELFHHTRTDGSAYPDADCPIHKTATDGQARKIGGEVFVRRDGSRFTVDYVCSPILENGTATGAVVIFRDTTETALAKARTEALMEELTRSNDELQQFAYVASHDLQEPLRMVTSYLQLLMRRYGGNLDAEGQEFAGYAVDGAQRMSQMINDLLAYSRVQSKGAPLVPVAADRALDEALANLRLAIEESEAVIAHDPLPQVIGDVGQLTSLFQNLIGNAIKYRVKDRPPRIALSATRRGEFWEFAVRDDGIGIAPAHFERIFMIFQRLHRREEYPGTGIGLAICKKIVERHGGRIEVESAPGQGSTFRFTLPGAEATRP